MPVSEPSKYTTLWSQSGIRFDIPPAADPVTGKAGFDVGFSSINMASEAAGGIPPWGQDFNGILFSITRAIQYVQSGALPTFSSDFSTAISGYKKGAMLIGVDGVTVWQSEVDGNTTNPDSLSASGWVNFPLKYLPKRTFAESDSIRIPDVDGGLIIQWGRTTSFASGQSNVTFPSEFPNSVLFAITGERVGSAWGPTTAVSYGVAGVTNTNMAVVARTITGTSGPVSAAGLASYWLAIGF